MKNSNINFFAKTDFRGEGKIFGIKNEDRRLHGYITLTHKSRISKPNLNKIFTTSLPLRVLSFGMSSGKFKVH
jgi:hypothetical protein